MLRALPEPQKAVEVQNNLALTLNLNQIERNVFYLTEYAGKQIAVRVTSHDKFELYDVVDSE
jgi:hypothetical protein